MLSAVGKTCPAAYKGASVREFTFESVDVRIIRSRQPLINEAKYNCRRRSPSMEEQQDLLAPVSRLEGVQGAFMSEHNELIIIVNLSCNEERLKAKVMNVIHGRSHP